LGEEGKQAFQRQKDAFLQVLILSHFERGRKTHVEVDASGGAISGILSQLVPNDARVLQWKPVDFYSRKLIQAEYNYDTHDQELLAIVKSLEHWRHYLEGEKFEVLTDHHNLKWFMETKVLNHRQVRSYLALSRFDFVITHRPGSTNPADGPSRRPDYMAEAQKPSQKYNQAFVKPMQDLLYKSSREGAALVNAVTTRTGKGARDGSSMAEALNEFRKAERALQTGSSAQEGCDMKKMIRTPPLATQKQNWANLAQPTKKSALRDELYPKRLKRRQKPLKSAITTH
jgi:hypothetical protein